MMPSGVELRHHTINQIDLRDKVSIGVEDKLFDKVWLPTLGVTADIVGSAVRNMVWQQMWRNLI